MISFRISPSMAVVVVLILLTFLGAWRYDGFLGAYNVQSVLRYNSMFALVSLGMCFVIMTGGIDLSVGSIVGLSGVVAGYLMQGAPIPFTGQVAYPNIWAVLVISLIVGILFGWLNGLLVAKLNIAPFIATLGMLYVARGFAKLITNGETFTKLDGKPNLGNTGFIETFAAKPLGIPLPIWVMIAFAIALPTPVEPVKAILSISGCSVSQAPTCP